MGGLVGLLAVAVACTGAAARREARTHADVLESIAQKGVDLVRTGRLVAESMPVLTYPLERAQAFARTARRRERLDPATLAAFDTLVDRYRAFVDGLDRARRDLGRDEAARALAEPLAGVERAAAALRGELERADGRRQARGRSVTFFGSFTVASSADTVCPRCG
jgi:hypothetical protein